MLVPTLVFIFLLGLCVGSFLNVVVYRLPLGKSLLHPPSTCPKCDTRLAWYDNIPVLGWLKLGGKCRYCKVAISPRYPIVELATGLLFLGYALALFQWGYGPCPSVPFPRFSAAGLPLPAPLPEIARDWPVLLLHLSLLAILLAASLIDLETFTIPISLPITAAVVGLLGHAFLMTPLTLGNLALGPGLALASALAGLGLVAAFVLLHVVRVLPLSFPDGEPMGIDLATWQAEIDAARAENREPLVPLTPPVRWTRGMLNREMLKEIGFIAFPLAGFVVGLVLFRHTSFGDSAGRWLAASTIASGLLGSVLAGLVGGGFIWGIRILGTFGFGKLAMGLGDVHLMAAVGTVAGGYVATVSVIAGAFWGLAFTLYGFLFKRLREVPFGPYLALGTLTVMLVLCPVQTKLEEAWEGFVFSMTATPVPAETISPTLPPS
jgi:leader peptidase (prepilin peptidase)/N-methyltransferase